MKIGRRCFYLHSRPPPPALILRVGGAGEFKILFSVAGPSNIKAGGVGGSLFNALLQFSSPRTLSHRTQARLDRKRQKKLKLVLTGLGRQYICYAFLPGRFYACACCSYLLVPHPTAPYFVKLVLVWQPLEYIVCTPSRTIKFRTPCKS